MNDVAAFRELQPGDRLPDLEQAAADRPRFVFRTLAGRYQLYGFFLTAAGEGAQARLQALAGRRDLFNDVHCTFTGVSVTPADRDLLAGIPQGPGYRFAWDFDYTLSRACGAVRRDAVPGGPATARMFWLLVDPSQHILRRWPMSTPVEEIVGFIEALPPPDRFGGVHRPAPILLLPNVLEPEVCRRLIDYYAADGGADSGVHRDGAGVLDSRFKRRRDTTITDPDLLGCLRTRVARRVLPEIEKLFFMKISYMERHIIGCYSAEDGGHFAPHTDNGPGITAHRRYALSINLNDDFEGGEVVFPEYNLQGYKAPAGWAVVFPCAILHSVRKVRQGTRYCYLPFLYDEAGQVIRTAELAKAEAAAATT